MRKKVTIGVALLLSLSLLVACGGVAQEDYDAAVAAKTAADAKVTSLTSQLATAKSDLAKAASGLAAAQGELATAQSDLEAAQADAASAESAASSAKSAASSAKSALAAAEATVAELEATIAELEAAAAAAAEEEEEVAEEEEEEVAEEEEEEVAEEEEEAAAYEATATYEHPAEISFDATEVVAEEYGFSFKHPSNWSETTPDPPGEGDIYTAARPDTEGYTGMFVGSWDLDGNDTLESFPAALIAALTEAPVEILKAGPTTLADGTPAYAAEYNCTLSGWAMHSVSVGLIVGDQWITYNTWNIDVLGTPFDEDWLWEMAHTLTITE